MRWRPPPGHQTNGAIEPTAASRSATTFSRTVAGRWTAGTVAITANTAVSTAVTTAAPLRRASLSTPTTTPPSTSVSSENPTGRPPVRAAKPQVYAVLVAIAPASASQSPTYPARAATRAAAAAVTASSQAVRPSPWARLRSREARPWVVGSSAADAAGARSGAGAVSTVDGSGSRPRSARRGGLRAARLPAYDSVRRRGAPLDTVGEATGAGSPARGWSSGP